MQYLHVTNLRKSYGNHEVVAGIDLELKPGECFGLLGPNGAGKTTTLRLCLGLTEPDGGAIAMFGLPVPGRAREGLVGAVISIRVQGVTQDCTGISGSTLADFTVR